MESNAGSGAGREEGAEEETKEGVDRPRDGDEVDEGAKEHRGDDEEDLETGDVGAEVELEDSLVSKRGRCWGAFHAASAAGRGERRVGGERV